MYFFFRVGNGFFLKVLVYISGTPLKSESYVNYIQILFSFSENTLNLCYKVHLVNVAYGSVSFTQRTMRAGHQ